MTAREWDWTRRVFDHVQLSASDDTASVCFYETVFVAARNPEDRRARAGERGVRPGLTSRTSTSWTGDRRRPMVRRGIATTLLATTRLTCSTPMGTTPRPCTATSETLATLKVRRCTDPLFGAVKCLPSCKYCRTVGL